MAQANGVRSRGGPGWGRCLLVSLTLYISQGEKKKAEEKLRPLAFVSPEAGGNGPTPGLKKEGDARGTRFNGSIL
jgi:hypothetical protein